MSKEFEKLYTSYLGTTGNSTKISKCTQFLSNYVKENGWFNKDYDVQEEFLEFYPKWIESSKTVKVQGLETFPYRFVSLGVTQTLDWFHLECARTKRRLRMLRGEYPYNRDVFDFSWDNFIDDKPLERGDAVIISVPFSGSGNLHPMYDEIMETCNRLDIPVMVDCAWFGTCYDLEWTLDYDCIKVVAFSTTKGLQTGQFRSGICFSKWNHGSLSVQTEWHHGIHANVYAGLLLMKKFTPDTAYDLYKEHQKIVCNYFNLIPSHTIHVSLGDHNWNFFHRDKLYNRVNIRLPLLDSYQGLFDNKIKEMLK
jgi:hypothetical protein